MQPFSTVPYQKSLKPIQPTFSEIKNAAKGSLKNRWAEAIAVSLVFLSAALLDIVMQEVLMTIFRVDAVWTVLAPTSIPKNSVLASNCITVFSAVFSLTVMFPLIYGVLRWFWQVTGGGNPSVGEIFYYFSSGKLFFKSLCVSFGLFWRMLIGAFICFLPFTALTVLTEPSFYDEIGQTMPMVMESLTPLIDFCELLGFFALLLYTAIYVLFYTVLFSEPELSARKTLKLSRAVSKHNRIRFVGFFFSFFGWIALSLLMLPLLFTLPYMLASLAVYGREAYRSAHRISAP